MNTSSEETGRGLTWAEMAAVTDIVVGIYTLWAGYRSRMGRKAIQNPNPITSHGWITNNQWLKLKNLAISRSTNMTPKEKS